MNEAYDYAHEIPTAYYPCLGCTEGGSEWNCREANELGWHSGSENAHEGWYCEDCEDGIPVKIDGPSLKEVIDQRKARERVG